MTTKAELADDREKSLITSAVDAAFQTHIANLFAVLISNLTPEDELKMVDLPDVMRRFGRDLEIGREARRLILDCIEVKEKNP